MWCIQAIPPNAVTNADTAPTAGQGPALTRWHQQCAQAAETVGAHHAERNQLRQRLLDLAAQQAGAFHQFVEERRPVLANVIGHGLRADAGLDIVGRGRQRRPMRGVPPRH